MKTFILLSSLILANCKFGDAQVCCSACLAHYNTYLLTIDSRAQSEYNVLLADHNAKIAAYYITYLIALAKCNSILDDKLAKCAELQLPEHQAECEAYAYGWYDGASSAEQTAFEKKLVEEQTAYDAAYNKIVQKQNEQNAIAYNWYLLCPFICDPSCRVEEGDNASSAYISIFNLFPNPTAGNVSVEYLSKSTGNVQFIIYDALGKEVFTQTQKISEGISSTFHFDLAGLASGIYLLEARNGSDVSQKKFVIEK